MRRLLNVVRCYFLGHEFCAHLWYCRHCHRCNWERP